MLKTTVENYHINFSNSDFSVDIASICFKFLRYVFHSPQGKFKIVIEKSVFKK